MKIGKQIPSTRLKTARRPFPALEVEQFKLRRLHQNYEGCKLKYKTTSKTADAAEHVLGCVDGDKS